MPLSWNRYPPPSIDVYKRQAQDETPDSPPIWYTVQKGDTLWSIARRFGTTIKQLALQNNLSDPNLIYPGEHLMIRNTDKDFVYRIRRGDTLWDIARRFDTTVDELAALNHIADPDRIYVGETLIIPQ